MRTRLIFKAASGSIFMTLLLSLAMNAVAFELTPATIIEQEGTRIDLQVTIEPGDWQMPNSSWLMECANAGVTSADWIAIMRFDFVDGTAEFGSGPSDGDLHLTFSGSPRDDTWIWFQCETGSQAPTSNRFWTSFDLVINTDALDETSESATLNLMDYRINGSQTVADSTSITIEGLMTGPFSDWQVSVRDVMPTALDPGDDLSITAIGDRVTNPEFIYTGGWAVSFLISTDSNISMSDTVLASRSFGDFSFSFNETWTGPLNVQPGTYWVGACSTVSDDDSSNDCSMGVEIRVLSTDLYPDLAVIFLDATPRTVMVGGDIDITTDIENKGLAASDESTARVYLTPDGLISEDTTVIANANMPPLQPGQIWRGSGPVPVSVMPGDYYLAVCAEVVMNEIETTNNCGLGPMVTELPEETDGCSEQVLSCDITISSSLDSDDCMAGPRGDNHYAERFTFDGMIGDRLFLDATWMGSLDGYLYVESPAELTVAQNDNYTNSSNSRIEYELKENGMYTIWATSFETAEMGSFDLTLKCDSGSGPDLTLEAPFVSEGNLVAGQLINVETRLRNIGTESADSTQLRYYLSSNSTIDSTDTQLGSDRALGLSEGSSRAATRELVAPATPGTYFLGVCADQIPGEASSSNNCSAGTRFIVNPRPSCTARDMSCGEFLSGSISAQDCTNGPRGNGFLTERLEVDLSSGREVVFKADWGDLDGYLILTDPNDEVVAENDDAGMGSRLEYKVAQGGVHRLWVTSFDRNESGSFGVELECGASSAPDLVASTVILDTEKVNTGGALGISGTMRNNGSRESAMTTVNVMLSSDKEITTSDTVIGSIDLPALGANSLDTVETLLPAPDVAGAYYLGLCAVPVEGETLQTNNCSLGTAEAPAAGIQSVGHRSKPQNAPEENGTLLIVTSGNSCGDSSLSCGGSVGGTLGSADCDSGPRGTGFVSDPITFNGNQGDTVSLSAQWTGLDGYLYLEGPDGEVVAENDDSSSTGGSRLEVMLEQSGTYTVWPTAFASGASGSYQVVLECNNPQAPDLEVDKPTLSSTNIRSGQSVSVRTQTRNKGGFTAGSSVVDFILASSPELKDGDRILSTSDVPSLAGGASSTEETEVAINATPGTYYLGTCVNQDTQETDTDNNCDVAGPITIEATGEPIAINSGLNDAWYNPSTSGQGFFINIFPDNSQVFLSWFTFDTTRPPASVAFQLGDPGHRWLTAQGTYDLGVANLNVFLTQGGVFDAGTPTATTPYGTMTVSFTDCNNGTVAFNLPSVNESGTIAITRVSTENVAACEDNLGSLASVAAAGPKDPFTGIEADDSRNRIEADGDNVNGFNYNASLNDAWFNPATNGQGFFFNIFPDSNFVFLSWFTYETTRPADGTPSTLGEPGQRWLTAQGLFNGDTADLKVYSTSGGIFNQGSLPSANTVEVGTISASFEHCNSGLVSYDIDSIGRANDIPIQRTAPDAIPACELKSSGGSSGSGSGAGPAETVGSTAGVTPSGKPTLENLCDGSVDWEFNWPDVPGASFYLFELYRNDSLVGSPRVKTSAQVSQFSYSGKESSVEKQHLTNWRWRYQPVMSFGKKGRVSWSKDFYFNVKAPENPCLN